MYPVVNTSEAAFGYYRIVCVHISVQVKYASCWAGPTARVSLGQLTRARGYLTHTLVSIVPVHPDSTLPFVLVSERRTNRRGFCGSVPTIN